MKTNIIQINLNTTDDVFYNIKIYYLWLLEIIRRYDHRKFNNGKKKIVLFQWLI